MTDHKRPNILFLMADQMAPQATSLYGHPVCQTPNIQELGESGVVFDNAYTNCPLCAPARASMLSGRLGPSIGAYDNASELSASVPTITHYLRGLGYKTTLCGKMHFIGPDQLHGYEERIVTDVYPSSFAWMPNWDKGPTYISSGVSLRSVVEAGPCIRSLQADYDDEVEYFGTQKIYDLARDPDDRPFFLTISFTHPHTPFTAPQEQWDRYREDEIDMPKVGAIPLDELDAHSRGLYFAHGRNKHSVSKTDIRRSRRAYYGMISYVDDKIGRIIKILKDTGLAENTIVVFTSDHGEMLGERGMWYKHCFFEWSCRVPVIVSYPREFRPRRVQQVVSLVDLMPTLLDLATDGNPPEPVDRLDGHSMKGLMAGSDPSWSDTAIADYLAIGPCVATRMIRQGAYKLHYTYGHPNMVFNMEKDPDELNNLAGQRQYAQIEQKLLSTLMTDYNPQELDRQVRESQRRRFFIAEATDGKPTWAHMARYEDDRRYVRNAKVDDTKGRARFPYTEPVPPDKHETL